MSFINTLSSLYSTLSNISELHKFMGNTLVKFLGMSKEGVQSAKLLKNSHWLLDFPSPGFFYGLLTCSELQGYCLLAFIENMVFPGKSPTDHCLSCEFKLISLGPYCRKIITFSRLLALTIHTL